MPPFYRSQPSTEKDNFLLNKFRNTGGNTSATLFKDKLFFSGSAVVGFNTDMSIASTATTIIGTNTLKLLADGNTTLFVSAANNIYKSVTGENGTWTAIPATGVTGSLFIGGSDNNGNLCFVGGSGGVNTVYSTDGGATWTSITVTPTNFNSQALTQSSSIRYIAETGNWLRFGTTSINISTVMLTCLTGVGSATPASFTCCGYFNGYYYAYSPSTRLFYYSTDFISWGSFAGPIQDTQSCYTMEAFNNALYVFGDAGFAVKITSPGIFDIVPNSTNFRAIDARQFNGGLILSDNQTGAYARNLRAS